jgi:hypothetical protein
MEILARHGHPVTLAEWERQQSAAAAEGEPHGQMP